MKQWDYLKSPLVLRSRRDETPDTVSFFFEAQDQGIFEFKPGQFVIVKVFVDGRDFARAYSISSLPGSNMLQLTVKRVKGGVVSNWLIDHLRPDDVLWTLGIGGVFNVVDCKVRSKVVFISAGCGITPVLSMARYLCSLKQEPPEMLFLHRAHDMEHVISFADMNKLERECKRFQYHLFLTKPDEGRSGQANHGQPNGGDKQYLQGKITAGSLTMEQLRGLCPDYHDSTVFLCGPELFMQNVEDMLQLDGFDMQYFFHEDFSPQHYLKKAQSVSTEFAAPNGANLVQRYTVSVPGFNYQTQAEKDSLLLDVLDEGDIPVIGACRSGVCGACKCQVTKGRIASGSQAALSPQEIEQGFVLACSSKIIDNIEVSLK